jgi:hypothetical protein
VVLTEEIVRFGMAFRNSAGNDVLAVKRHNIDAGSNRWISKVPASDLDQFHL